ncbi:MAG: HdeD family acid-resistance protein [Rhizomicrobium sp.]
MTDTNTETPFHGRVRGASGRLLWLGLALSLLGIAAIVFPMASTLVAALVVGWTLLFGGALIFVGSFSIHGTGPFFGALLTGLLSLAAGVFILFSPLAGAVALTLLLGFLFMFQGAFEIFFAFELRPLPGWWSMLLSGLASAFLAIVIAAGWPEVSTIALGILLGVNFLSTGLGYIFVSRALKP